MTDCPLTKSERQVVQCLADGLTYCQIAHQLGKSESTVRTQLRSAYRKLGVIDRAQAVLRCYKRGWVDFADDGEPSRECALLRRVESLLSEIHGGTRSALSGQQRSYLRAFMRYLAAPTTQASRESREQMAAHAIVVLDEAGVIGRGTQRLTKAAA